MPHPITSAYLESHVYHLHGRGWKSLCPACGGTNLYYTQDNGLCYCFNCTASYRVQGTVVEHLDTPCDVAAVRAYYGELAAHYHRCLPRESRAYLHQRGVDDEAIAQYGIGYCPSGECAWYRSPLAVESGVASPRGTPSLAERITVPYVVDGEVTDIRGRATRPDQNPKYKSLFGSSARRGAQYPFNWERAVLRARIHKVLIVTEGEFKALVADRFGFACVALPGMTSWRQGFVGDADWRIVVVFDALRDRRAQWHVDRAIARLTERLPRIYVGRLPLLGEEKQDLDSFLMHRRGGAARLQQVVDQAVPYAEYARLRAF